MASPFQGANSFQSQGQTGQFQGQSGQTPFMGLRPTSFGGVVFPAERITLHSVGRQHLHEFPHAPAGAPEKLGRGVWYLTVRGNFSSNRFPKYPDLYPAGMNALRSLYEQQITTTFVHPTVGEFQAFITSWRQEYEPGKIQSGEKVDMEFLEDQQFSFLTQSSPQFIDIGQAQSNVDAQLAAVNAAVASSFLPAFQAGLFDQLRATVNAVSALGNTVGVYGQLYLSKLAELQGCCSQLQDSFGQQGSSMVGVSDAVRQVWANAQALQQQATPSVSLSDWTVPRTMSAMDIALRIYGDAGRQGDILTLNPQITNPYAVPAGTDIAYYPAQGSQAANSSSNS